MLNGGEDVKFIARRLMILAVEEHRVGQSASLGHRQQCVSGGKCDRHAQGAHHFVRSRHLSGHERQKQRLLHGH